jgi:hypothetical protein
MKVLLDVLVSIKIKHIDQVHRLSAPKEGIFKLSRISKIDEVLEMDIDKIVLEFRKLYQMDFGIKTDEYTYIVKENGMIDGQLDSVKQRVSTEKLSLEFPSPVSEDIGTAFLLSVLKDYFEDMSYDRHFEALMAGSLSKEKTSEYMKRIAGKRMDYLRVTSEDLDSVIRIIQASFINGICVKDTSGIIVFMEDEVDKEAIEGTAATIEVELFTDAKWIVGEAIDINYPLDKQRNYLRSASYLLQDYVIGDDVITLSDLLPYTLIDACPEEVKSHLIGQVFKHLGDIQLDEELTATIEMMFEQDLNLTDSARALYIHRNTLLYRIEKIHKLTGYDLRKFSDAFIFRLAWLMRSTR